MIILNNYSNLKVYWQLIPSLLKCFNSIQPCQNWTLKSPNYCMMSAEIQVIKHIFYENLFHSALCSRIFLPLFLSHRISLSPKGNSVFAWCLLVHPKLTGAHFGEWNAKNTAISLWSFQQIEQLSLHYNVTSCLFFYLIISWSSSIQFAIYFCQLKRLCVPSIILVKANYEKKYIKLAFDHHSG